MSDIHISRGCGSRQKGGFYLESKTDSGGTLNLLTYCFGSHVDSGQVVPASNLLADIPARGVWLGDLAGSFLRGEWCFLKDAFVPATGDTVVYEEFQTRFISPVALGDKVSKQYYSCASFIEEAKEHGPSRKIPEAIAKQVVQYLPLPIVFFFDLPLFRSEEQRDALLAACGIEPNGLEFEPLWNNLDYGISVEYANTGQDHFMSHLAGCLDADEAKDFIQAESVQTAVMPGCICWLNQARYMLNEGEDLDTVQGNLWQHGIEVVDLDT